MLRSMLFPTFLALLSLSVALPTEHIKIARQNINAAAPPRLVAYIQTFHDTSGNPLSLLPLLQEKTGVSHVFLSSLHLNQNPGDITLNDESPNDSKWNQMWSEVKQLQQGGIKVLMMLGGAAQGSYRRLSGDDASFHSYYDPLLQILKNHTIDGLDLDIEESVDVSVPLRLLRQLNTDLGSAFLLTMAPVASALLPNGAGLSGFSYHDLDAQATDSSRPNGKLVNWYNAQFYNGWGDASTQVGYNNIVQLGSWPADRVVMGVLDNPNDGGSGFVKIDTLTSVVKQLRANYATFGCAVGWEYWDAGGADGYAQPWEWVKAVGDAVYADTSGTAQNLTTDLKARTQTPWSGDMETLVGEGSEWYTAVRALNQTNGDLAAAEKLLGLVGGLVGGVLGVL